MKRNIILGLTTAGLATLAVGSVWGYSLISPNRTWATLPVNVKVMSSGENSVKSPDPDFGVTALVNALNSSNAWNGTIPGIVSASSTATAYVLGDGTPTISFTDPLHYCSGSCLAVTLTGYYHNAGGGVYSIDDADVFTNPKTSLNFNSETEVSDPSCTKGYYLEGIMVHEVGHVLGLGHSTNASATMYSYVSQCDAGEKVIHSDDQSGINYLY